MKRSRLAVSAMALTLIAGAAAPLMPAFAGDSSAQGPKVEQGTAQTDPAASNDHAGQQSLLPFQVSRDAAFGLQEVRTAQAMLRGGDTKAAQDLLTQAKSRFETAQSGAITLDQLPSKQGENVAPGKYFPVGVQTMIREDLSGQPGKQAAVGKAGEQMKAGDREGAKETLRVNEIDVATVVALLPQDQTMQTLSRAVELIGQDKAADAAQTLASIERGVIVEGVGIKGVPKSTDTAQAGQTADGPANPAARPMQGTAQN